jgi:hypothetical protein
MTTIGKSEGQYGSWALALAVAYLSLALSLLESGLPTLSLDPNLGTFSMYPDTPSKPNLDMRLVFR